MNEQASKAYQDGYETGKNWIHDYVPGGPWIYRVSFRHKGEEKYEAMARESKQQHDDWMHGWKDGRLHTN